MGCSPQIGWFPTQCTKSFRLWYQLLLTLLLPHPFPQWSCTIKRYLFTAYRMCIQYHKSTRKIKSSFCTRVLWCRSVPIDPEDKTNPWLEFQQLAQISSVQCMRHPSDDFRSIPRHFATIFWPILDLSQCFYMSLKYVLSKLFFF